MKESMDLSFITNILKENNDNIVLALYNNDLELSDLFEGEELDEVSECWNNLLEKLNQTKKTIKEQYAEPDIDENETDDFNEYDEELEEDYEEEPDEQPMKSSNQPYNIYDPMNNVRHKILSDIEDIYSENDCD